MDRRRGDSVSIQLLGESIGPVLGAGEHQHLSPFTGSNQVGQ